MGGGKEKGRERGAGFAEHHQSWWSCCPSSHPVPTFLSIRPGSSRQGRAPRAVWGREHSVPVQAAPRGCGENLGGRTPPGAVGLGREEGGEEEEGLALTESHVPAERRPPQPEPAQVLRARGERQGRRVDRGRARVPKAKATKDDRVGAPPPWDTAPGLPPPPRSPGMLSPASLCFLSSCRSPTLVKNMISGLGYGALNASYQVRTQPWS